MKRFFIKLNQILTATRTFLFNMIFLFLIVAILFAITSSPENKKPQADVLVLELTGNLSDKISHHSPIDQALSNIVKEVDTFALTALIRKASTDSNIKAILILPEKLAQAHISQIANIGDALKEFKKSDKPVYSYATYYTQNQYLLASYADEVWLDPMGSVEIKGLGVYRNYLKGALDKLKLNYHIFKAGKYKSATDVLSEKKMPKENKTHNLEFIKSIWLSYQQIVLDNRPISIDDLIEFTNSPLELLKQAQGNMAQVVLEKNLVDALLTNEQVYQKLATIVKRDADSDFHTISHIKYQDSILFQVPNQHAEIGLIIASGLIHSGNIDTNGINSNDVVTQLRLVRKDKSIKALIFHIDSGGGSAYASEKIRRALELTRKQGIKVVVSMGSVTASGGYWIATAADEIWASRATITGSIGVFGAIPTLENSLKDLGIQNDGIGSSPMADSFVIGRPLNKNLAEMLQLNVEFIYRKFTSLVKTRRNIDAEKMDQIAQGRVWSGAQAKELELIDGTGTFSEIVRTTAKLASIDNTHLKIFERKPAFWELLYISAMQEATHIQTNHFGTIIKQLFVSELETVATMWNLPNDPKHTFLLCPSCNQVL